MSAMTSAMARAAGERVRRRPTPTIRAPISPPPWGPRGTRQSDLRQRREGWPWWDPCDHDIECCGRLQKSEMPRRGLTPSLRRPTVHQSRTRSRAPLFPLRTLSAGVKFPKPLVAIKERSQSRPRAPSSAAPEPERPKLDVGQFELTAGNAPRRARSPLILALRAMSTRGKRALFVGAPRSARRPPPALQAGPSLWPMVPARNFVLDHWDAIIAAA